jgi:3-hydroxyisobutyrate dehydrogenase-like beta-hydroxyacid dehydrogenase
MLDAMGTTVHHCGPVGTGIRTKLVNNYLAIILCQLNAEALALSQRFGLDLTKTLEVCYGTTATNGQLKINWPNKVLKGDIEPGFTIDLATRTLDHHRGGERREGAAARRGCGPRNVLARPLGQVWPGRLLGHGRRALRRRRHRQAARPEGWTPPA